jgi:hypothetical protein
LSDIWGLLRSVLHSIQLGYIHVLPTVALATPVATPVEIFEVRLPA